MPMYRRAFEPGGTFFFTVVTCNRQQILCNEAARACLREAMSETRAELPFEMLGVVLLRDHLHCLWQLPEDESDFSTRWGHIKRLFTRRWKAIGGSQEVVSSSRQRHREAGVWQRRFWEHTIGDDDDLVRHLDYVHYNPVKHGVAGCPHAWPYSSFRRWVEQKRYAFDWQCNCGDSVPEALDFTGLDESTME